MKQTASKVSALFIVLIFSTLGFFACKKSTVSLSPLASLNVVNATVNLGSVKAKFTGTNKTLVSYWSGITTSIAYGANTAYGVNAETDVPLTIAPFSTAPLDTLHPVYSSTLHLVNGGIYSLFLTGQTGAIDTILIKDNIPSYTDSVFGFRFVNLSFNSTPVNITLTTGTTVTTEFSNIAYKGITNFKSYQAKYNTAPDTIRVRDASSNTQIAQYVFIASGSTNATTTLFPRFFNCTLALVGQIGVSSGTNVPKLIRVNNY